MMTNIIESFIEYCDRLMIAIEERGPLPRSIMKDSATRKKYSKSVHDLIDKVRNNSDNCIEHATEKHLNYQSAKRFFKPNKTVSYFIKGADLIDLTCKALIGSENEIIYLLYNGYQDLTITFGYQMYIGKSHFGEDPDDANDEYVSTIRIGISKEGETKKGAPILKIHTAYPIPEKDRIFWLNR